MGRFWLWIYSVLVSRVLDLSRRGESRIANVHKAVVSQRRAVSEPSRANEELHVLNQRKRDLRTIEQIQADMKLQKERAMANVKPTSSANTQEKTKKSVASKREVNRPTSSDRSSKTAQLSGTVNKQSLPMDRSRGIKKKSGIEEEEEEAYSEEFYAKNYSSIIAGLFNTRRPHVG